MNKKQKNRKIVQQNKRNRMVNRRYSSTIKSLTKLCQGKIKTLSNLIQQDLKLPETDILNVHKIKNTLTSFIDKAVKKQVIQKNTAARKKSKISKIFQKIKI